MKRLHIATSRKPFPGAVDGGDTLVFMDAMAAREWIDEVLSENPQISRTDLRVIKQAENCAETDLEAVEYRVLVELVTSSDSVVSW